MRAPDLSADRLGAQIEGHPEYGKLICLACLLELRKLADEGPSLLDGSGLDVGFFDEYSDGGKNPADRRCFRSDYVVRRVEPFNSKLAVIALSSPYFDLRSEDRSFGDGVTPRCFIVVA